MKMGLSHILHNKLTVPRDTRSARICLYKAKCAPWPKPLRGSIPANTSIFTYRRPLALIYYEKNYNQRFVRISNSNP
jgi:hypothetical protein